MGATNPGHPCPLIFPERDLPCRLERLEEFIRLEKRANNQRVDETEGDEGEEDGGGRDFAGLS